MKGRLTAATVRLGASCKGFFGRMKNGMCRDRSWKDVSIETFMSRVDRDISWRNQKRIKLSPGGLSPVEYRPSVGTTAWSVPRKRPHPPVVDRYAP